MEEKQDEASQYRNQQETKDGADKTKISAAASKGKRSKRNATCLSLVKKILTVRDEDGKVLSKEGREKKMSQE